MRNPGAVSTKLSTGSWAPADIGYILVVGLLGGLASSAGLPPIVLIGFVAVLAVVAVAIRFSRIANLGMSMVLATAFLQPMNGLGVGGIEFCDIVLFATLGALIVIRLAEGRPLGPPTYRPIVAGALILALAGVVGAVFGSREPFLYTNTGGEPIDMSGLAKNLAFVPQYLIAALGPLAVFALSRPNRIEIRRILLAFVAGQTVSVLIGFAIPSTQLANRIAGLAIHPGQFGSLGVLSLGAAMGLAFTRRPFPTWGYGVLPVLGLGVVGSGSRAALGGLVVVLLLAPIVTGRRVLVGLILTGGALVLVVVLLGLVDVSGGENAISRSLAPDSTTASLSTEGRGSLVSMTFERWLERPLTGNGLGLVRPSHNVYVGILAAGGVLGVIGFGTWVSTLMRRAWARRDDMLVLCATLGYVGYLAAAFFDNIISWRWLWFYIAALTALSATVPAPDEPGHEALRARRARGFGPRASAEDQRRLTASSESARS